MPHCHHYSCFFFNNNAIKTDVVVTVVYAVCMWTLGTTLVLKTSNTAEGKGCHIFQSANHPIFLSRHTSFSSLSLFALISICCFSLLAASLLSSSSHLFAIILSYNDGGGLLCFWRYVWTWCASWRTITLKRQFCAVNYPQIILCFHRQVKKLIGPWKKNWKLHFSLRI